MADLIKIKGNEPFSIRNLSETRAEILIYADIGDSWFDDSITLSQFKEKLDALDKTVNEITVRINSPGGDVFQGFGIYNLLKQHSAKVIVYIDGWAASIASIIALAGDEVIMGEGALFMVHKPWTWTAGNSNDLQNTIEILDKIEQQLIGIYNRKSGIDRVELEQMLADTTWLDAKQALEKGFVDRIMEDEEKVNAAASSRFFDRANWLNKKPSVKKDNEIARDRINDFKSKIQGVIARK